MGDLLAPVGAPVDRLLEQVALHLQHAAGHDVVEGGHAFEQRHVLESARDALARRDVGAHGPALDAAKLDAALLRMIEAVDDVQHRGLAGAVRSEEHTSLQSLMRTSYAVFCL